MGDNENWRGELDIDGLNLIDISAEDDSLLFSSFLDPTSYDFSDIDKEDRGLSLIGDTHNRDEEIMGSNLEEKEQVLQPHQSPEAQKMTNNGKYNVRSSLAWDKAFFTNAGVLEQDELSSMIKRNHIGERKNLPTIQEDVNRSSESISSDAVTPDKSKELRAKEAPPSPTPSTLDDPASQEKMKPNGSRKKQSIRVQGSGKATKPSIRPVAAKKCNTSISRPPNGLSKTIKALVDVNKAKQEKNPKLTGGKEHLAPRVPVARITRPVVPKPVVPSKSSLRSSVASKNELTSSCSSLESCATVSSSPSKKSSRDLINQKKDQNLRIASHSLANGSTFRAASKNVGQPKVSPLSASRAYKSKLSSYEAPLSSSLDWSSISPQASTANKMSKGNHKTVTGERGPAIDDTAQNLKPLNKSKDISAVQDDLKLDKQGTKRGSVVNSSTVRSASMMKPTGLRVPSPKIVYLEGARSSVARAPTRSCTGPGSGLAKHGASSPNASRTKPGKSQPTNYKAKVSPVSRSPRLIVSTSAPSPKLTNKMYSKVSAEEQLIKEQ